MAAAVGDLEPRGVPRQRRAIERRRLILLATYHLLGKYGVDGITTSSIAAEAGVPVASIYGYFPNKMAIIAELMRETMADVDSRLERMLPDVLDLDMQAGAIDRAIDTVLEVYYSDPAKLRLYSMVRGSEVLEPVAQESDARMAASLAGNLARLCPHMPAIRARAIAQTVVQTFAALQHGVVACPEPALFAALVAEWRRLLKVYLAQLAEP